MSSDFEPVFIRLRSILQKHAARFSITADAADRYCLEAPAGPATLRAWGGKLKRRLIPVAWVEIGKGYVSYHLMPVDGNARLRDGMSDRLKARMQGKTCFNFKADDEDIFKELERVTAQGLAAFKEAGFIAEYS